MRSGGGNGSGSVGGEDEDVPSPRVHNNVDVV